MGRVWSYSCTHGRGGSRPRVTRAMAQGVTKYSAYHLWKEQFGLGRSPSLVPLDVASPHSCLVQPPLACVQSTLLACFLNSMRRSASSPDPVWLALPILHTAQTDRRCPALLSGRLLSPGVLGPACSPVSSRPPPRDHWQAPSNCWGRPAVPPLIQPSSITFVCNYFHVLGIKDEDILSIDLKTESINKCKSNIY
jgi:hypothetical protein